MPTLFSSYFENLSSFFVTDTHCRYRQPPSSLLQLFRFKHTSMGGVTGFRCLYGSSKIQSYSPSTTIVQRRIGDILDYGVKSKLFQPGSLSTLPTILYDKSIPINITHADIIFPTTYFGRGLVIRPLTNVEFAKCFGLPTALQLNHVRVKDFNVVPCQIIESLLKPVLTTTPHREYVNLKAKQFPQQILDPNSTYFPLIKKILPHLWCSRVENSDVVAKYDDADVPTYLWEKRITLIWPHLKLILPKLRKWLLNKICRKLYLEFKQFMLRTYGLQWTDFLVTLTKRRSLIGILGGMGKEINNPHLNYIQDHS